MLEKPDLEDGKIVACLREAYGVFVGQVDFMPLGADPDTAVYRVSATDETPYFVKTRSGVVDEISVTLPGFLRKQGIAQVMAPLETRSGDLSADVGAYTLTLYPFVLGQTGREREMSARHWSELGAALARIHALIAPPGLAERIRRESYSADARLAVRRFLARVDQAAFTEPVAIALAALLKERREIILDLVARAERFARALRDRAPEFVVCHSDLHAGNVLLEADGALHIVDWDTPTFAPKERDLMFIGGGQGFVGRTAREEEALFYRGYGPTQLDPVALSYYRCERIVQDVAVYCDQLLTTDAGGEDRAQSLRYLAANFVPGGTVEIACQQ